MRGDQLHLKVVVNMGHLDSESRRRTLAADLLCCQWPPRDMVHVLRFTDAKTSHASSLNSTLKGSEKAARSSRRVHRLLGMAHMPETYRSFREDTKQARVTIIIIVGVVYIPYKNCFESTNNRLLVD